MITSLNFKGKNEFIRKGVTGKVILPKEIEDRTTFDIEVDAENKSVNFVEGDSVYVIADEFGIADEADVTAFFIDGGVVMELVMGTLYLKGKNGVVYGVDEEGEIIYPDESIQINWVNVDTLKVHTSITTQTKYGTPDHRTEEYVNNLAFSILFRHILRGEKGERCPLFSTKVMRYFTDLGLGIFNFTVYDYVIDSIVDDSEPDYVDILNEQEEEHIDDSYDMSDLDSDDVDDFGAGFSIRTGEEDDLF